jgi:hypothetical protein
MAMFPFGELGCGETRVKCRCAVIHHSGIEWYGYSGPVIVFAECSRCTTVVLLVIKTKVCFEAVD